MILRLKPDIAMIWIEHIAQALIAVVDWDVHHGNGLGYTVNIPLQPGGGHDSYMYAFERLVVPLADRHAGGKLVAVHEGGCAEACVPFCGLAVMEEMSGHRTAVQDPFTEFFGLQQPSARFQQFQRGLIDEMAQLFLS